MKKEVDFSVHVKEVMNRNNVQVQSFALLDDDVKNRFFQDRKKAVLLIHNKVYEREINSLDDKTIDVFDTMLIPYLKNGQLVLLVLPTEDKLRYVLQTSVVGLFVDRIRLKTLDPRKNQRFSLSGDNSVQIRKIEDATALRIRVGELRSVRQIAGIMMDDFLESIKLGNKDADRQEFSEKLLQSQSKENNGGVSGKGESPGQAEQQAGDVNTVGANPSIQDMLFCAEKDEPAKDYNAIREQTSVEGTIVDISIGGMCITCREDKEAFFTDQLVALECSLENEEFGSAAQRLALFVFGVVRNHVTSEGVCRMSLEFLSLLPKTVEGYFRVKETELAE